MYFILWSLILINVVYIIADHRPSLPWIVTVSMKWKSPANQHIITRHYALRHRHYSRFCLLPWLYTNCVCTFKRQIDLKNHLLRQHGTSQDSSEPLTAQVLCELCSYSEPCILIETEEQCGDVLPKEIIDILEEHLVLIDISDVPKAFGFLMGLLYVVNIN